MIYSKYATTVIGAYSVPDWYESLDRLVSIGHTTGYTRNAIVHHGRLDAGVEMIGKPFTLGELSVKVQALLDRG